MTQLHDAADAEIAFLRATLAETRNGNDKSDGLPCWCPSPTYAGRRPSAGPLHSLRCLTCRAALGCTGTGVTQPETAIRCRVCYLGDASSLADGDGDLCVECLKSYAEETDGTVSGTLLWAANRARYFALRTGART